jgi:hypothetical protein
LKRGDGPRKKKENNLPGPGRQGGGKGMLILDPNFKEVDQFGDFTG